MAALLEAEGLTAGYGQTAVLHGIDFAVEERGVSALLGANGAGKTTTVETLEGHHTPFGGAVRVLGHDPLRDRATVRPRIGIMLQTEQGARPAR